MEKEEEKRPIPGFPGYSITADGRVWSHPRAWSSLHGIEHRHPGMWMRSTLESKRGYQVISLSPERGQRTRRTQQIHRLVALAWLPNPDRRPYVNHRNGIKTDNRASNLEWCTASENMHHAYAIGLQTMTPAKRAALAKNHATGPRGPKPREHA